VEGVIVGISEGKLEGVDDGESDGVELGCRDGGLDGSGDGTAVGSLEGTVDGADDGLELGSVDGCAERSKSFKGAKVARNCTPSFASAVGCSINAPRVVAGGEAVETLSVVVGGETTGGETVGIVNAHVAVDGGSLKN
jgi:hypothetical protein